MDSLGQDDMGLCGTQVRNGVLTGVMIAVLVTNFSCCMFVVYFSYKVIIKIRNHKREAVAQSQIQSRLLRESQEIITVIVVISAVPLFTQLPAVIVKFLQIFFRSFSPWVGRILISTFPLTGAINPFVTIYVVKEYRNKFLKFFRRSTQSLTGQEPVGPSGGKKAAWVNHKSVGHVSNIKT
jgi:hypothetical protein